MELRLSEMMASSITTPPTQVKKYPTGSIGDRAAGAQAVMEAMVQ